MRLPSFPTFATQWYDPLVHPNWPQNAGPLPDAQVPGACGGCHMAGGQGGRFPLLTSTLLRGAPAYCPTVLNKAVNRTMPPANPGSLSGNAAVQAFQALCNRTPRPLARIENTTLNFGEVEIGFTFSKGLVVHNDGDADLTVGVAVQGSPDTTIWTDIGVAANVTIKPGDPPLVLRQEFKPKATGAGLHAVAGHHQ